MKQINGKKRGKKHQNIESAEIQIRFGCLFLSFSRDECMCESENFFFFNCMYHLRISNEEVEPEKKSSCSTIEVRDEKKIYLDGKL